MNNKKCGLKCEVYARVTGYIRPVNVWNKGKKEEFINRKEYITNNQKIIKKAIDK